MLRHVFGSSEEYRRIAIRRANASSITALLSDESEALWVVDSEAIVFRDELEILVPLVTRRVNGEVIIFCIILASDVSTLVVDDPVVTKEIVRLFESEFLLLVFFIRIQNHVFTVRMKEVTAVQLERSFALMIEILLRERVFTGKRLVVFSFAAFEFEMIQSATPISVDTGQEFVHRASRESVCSFCFDFRAILCEVAHMAIADAILPAGHEFIIRVEVVTSEPGMLLAKAFTTITIKCQHAIVILIVHVVHSFFVTGPH